MGQENVVLKLGGSLINPGKVNTHFLSRFKEVVKSFLPNYSFVVVCGGGKLCREFDEAAARLGVTLSSELDLLGIRATQLNAELVRAVFGALAYKRVVRDYTNAPKFRNIIVCSGWLPGHSTDFDAVMFAKAYKAKQIFNITNVDHIYNKDPKKHRDGLPFTRIRVAEYLSLVGDSFTPGMNVPFDPLAAKELRSGLKVVVLSGLNNLKAALSSKAFEGTLLEP